MSFPFNTGILPGTRAITPDHAGEHNRINAWRNRVIMVDGLTYPLTAAGINLALANCHSVGGGTVLLPPGIIPISTSIIHKYPHVELIGTGQGWTMHSATLPDTYGTILKWTGGDVGTGTFIVDFGAATGASYHVFSSKVSGVHINGDGKSVSGMRARSIANCDVEITSGACEGAYLLNWDIQADIDSGGLDYSGNQFNRVKASLTNFGVTNGGGMTTLSDVGICSYNTFDLRVYHVGNKKGINWRNCDSNTFHFLAISRGSGTQIGFHMSGATGAYGGPYANSNNFLIFDWGEGGYTQDGNAGIYGPNRFLSPDYYNAGGATPVTVTNGVLARPPTGEVVKANRTASQAIATGGATIVFNTEVVDNNYQYDPATGVFLPAYAGWWNLHITVHFATLIGDTGKTYQLRLYSGSNIIAISAPFIQETALAQTRACTIAGPVYLPAAATVAYLYHDAGADRNVTDSPAAAGSGCIFSAVNLSRD